MSKPVRYLLYFLLGVLIYYAIGADENPGILEEYHQYAPIYIIAIMILLFYVKRRREQKERDQEE